MDLARAKLVLETRLSEIHTVADIAKHLGVSGETLRKEFMRRERMPLSDYVRLQRVTAMKDALLNSDKPCHIICFEAGFRREDTGAKVFKRVTGVTMQEFRDKRRTKNLCG